MSTSYLLIYNEIIIRGTYRICFIALHLLLAVGGGGKKRLKNKNKQCTTAKFTIKK